ncbi:hypothetical protein [Bartonella phoceensis]|uniref:hypothetical protein n=1 Tax=Bartonella phoceensis TaxID=270249 RepID=UPI001ABBC997|nr:hypothetical protein [Bartonella phoceensis]
MRFLPASLSMATITEHAGSEADTFEVEFNDSGNDLEVPQSNSGLQIIFEVMRTVSVHLL